MSYNYRLENMHHVIGSVYRFPERNRIACVPIPKNASSFMRNIFHVELNWGLVRHHPCDISNIREKYIVFLRDPVERWKSAIIEYFCRQEYDASNFNDFLQFAAKEIFFDEHTAPQNIFLKRIDPKRIIFFKVDRGLIKNLTQFLSIEFPLLNLDLSKFSQNKSSDVEGKTRMFEHIDEYDFNHPRFDFTLRRAYEEDYNLLNEVDFYGKLK